MQKTSLLTWMKEAENCAFIGSRLLTYDMFSEGVSRTTFENGICVWVNRTTQPFTTPDGLDIAEMSYRIEEARE